MSPSALECWRTEWPSDSSAATRKRPRNPVAPVTRISFFIRQELLPTFIELINRPHVIVHAANIQPVPGIPFHVHRLLASQHVEHEVVEAVLLSRRDALQQRPIHDVDPHTHHILQLWLLLESN